MFGRYTTSAVEIQHLNSVCSAAPPFGIVVVTLRGQPGTKITGMMMGQSFGNNAGLHGVWHYRASMQVRDLAGHTHYIDFLDVVDVVLAPQAEQDKFGAKGIGDNYRF